MTAVTCPECKDEVSVPAGVSAEAQVKCPLCGVEFSMTRIARQLPPELIVMEDSSGGGSRTAEASPFQIKQGFKAVDSAPAGAFSFEEKSAPEGPKPTYAADSDTTETKTPRTTARATARPSGRKKEKNMIFEGLKVIVGGLAAFPVVQLAVWWIGRTDPLDLGPKVGNVVPFVVPKHLRSSQVENDEVGEGSAAEIVKPRTDYNPMDNIRDQKATDSVSRGKFDGSSEKKLDSGLVSKPDFDNVATVSNSRPKLSVQELLAEKDADNHSQKPTLSGGKGSTVDELNQAITELLNVPPMVAGQDNAENQDRYFAALCSLAENLATVKGDGREVENAKSAAYEIVPKDFPRPLQATSLRGKKLWDSSPKNHTGIVICGKLIKAAEQDDYYQAEIAWAHEPGETISIYSKDAALLDLAPDSEIVALGTVVDGPSNHLPPGQLILATLTVPLN